VLKFPTAQISTKLDRQKGNLLFSKEVNFLKGVVDIIELPNDKRIEVCFAGRSNVGKSSLINALTFRKSLARSSNTPGRTQEINFFSLADTNYLVDLPGYGYAYAPVNKVEKWQKLLKDYLKGRVSLRRVFLLIDSRHGVKEIDEDVMSLLDKVAVTFQIVITKIDKPKKSELELSIEKTRKALVKHPAAFPEILLTSSTKMSGIETVRSTIANIE
tara:strand:+ start:1460 stop:2107 length:648 start_codon:yes stop_codon:yes gene_type:complete